MKKWSVLKEGDVVDFVATSNRLTDEEIFQSVKYVKSIGLVPRVPEGLQGEDLFHANSDEERFRHLKNGLYAEDSQVVWCLRGGYGAAKLLPMLDELDPPKNPKLLIGFSDITAIHIFLNQKWGWTTIHGPLLFSLGRGSASDETVHRIENLVFGKDEKQEFSLVPLNEVGGDNIEAVVTGGNLTIVQNSIGTLWQIEPAGKILLLEEVDDQPYHVDRMLNHLWQSGRLDGVKAVVFGDFNGEKRKVDQEMIDKTLAQFAKKASFPVFRSPGIGHEATNRAVPLGTKSTITFGNKPVLICENGSV